MTNTASFRATLREAQNEVLNTATRSLLLFAQPAVYALAGAMTDELARPSERARAASALLSHLVALREHTDHDDRLLTLEKKAHDKKR